MKYYKPVEVTSPKDFIKIIEILDEGDEDSYAIAIIEWEGIKQVGIRWNVARREWNETEKINERKTCVGMPSSHGYPVWFILPDTFLFSLLNKTNVTLTNKVLEILNSK